MSISPCCNDHPAAVACKIAMCTGSVILPIAATAIAFSIPFGTFYGISYAISLLAKATPKIRKTVSLIVAISMSIMPSLLAFVTSTVGACFCGCASLKNN